MEPTPTSTGSDAPVQSELTERVRTAGAERYGTDLNQIEVSDPLALAPSVCILAATWNRNLPGGDSRRFVLLPDDSLTPVGSDDALSRVSKRCFLDSGILPDADTVPLLALQVAERRADLPLGEPEGRRLLGALGAEWSPPSVTATDDGFVMSMFAQDSETGEIFEVTSTISEDAATTEYRLIG